MAKRKGAPARQARATSRKKAPVAVAVAEVDVVEDESGMGIEGAVAIITTIVLLAGILFLDYQLGSNYTDRGFFF